jgi:hypothetical protein
MPPLERTGWRSSATARHCGRIGVGVGARRFVPDAERAGAGKVPPAMCSTSRATVYSSTGRSAERNVDLAGCATALFAARSKRTTDPAPRAAS